MATAPVITFLSDLGNKHIATGSAKARLWVRFPEAGVVDITHGAERYNIQRAAYMCRSAYQHFPAGSFHLLLVDISLGERHRMLLAHVGGHYFIAPDNGILSLAFGDELRDVWFCREFSNAVGVLQWADAAADVIAAIGAEAAPDEHFTRFMTKKIAFPSVQRPAGARRDCAILYADRYGNVVLDLDREEFEELAGDGPFEIKFPAGKSITRLSTTYNDVAEGELLCRFNGLGLMEIAMNRQSLFATYEFAATYNAFPTISVYF